MSKAEISALQKKYEKLMKESFKLSKTDRRKADEKYAEAEEVGRKIDQIQKG